MKRIVFNLLLAVFCMMAFSFNAFAQSSNTVGVTFFAGDIKYKITQVATSSANGKVAVIRKNSYNNGNPNANVVIPATLNRMINGIRYTFDVNKIEANVFDTAHNNLNSVTIEMLTGSSVDANAFNGCTISGDVSVSASTISAHAFSGVFKGNTTLIVYDNGELVSEAFKGSTFEHLIIRTPEQGQTFNMHGGTFRGIEQCKLLTIENKRFFHAPFVTAYKSNVESLEIENGIEVRNHDNTTVTRRRVSSNLTNTKLKSVKIGNNCTINGGAFDREYDEMVIDSSTLRTVNIGDNVTIKTGAFKNQAALREVTIGKNCTMEAEAFCNTFRRKFNECDTFDYEPKTSFVTIAEGCTAIPEGAFNRAVHLNNVTLPNSVETIGDSAFAACQNLKNLNIPTSLKSIGAYGFKSIAVEVANEDDLLDIVLPDAFQTLGEYAFAEARIKSIDLGKSIITAIPDYCFAADIDPNDDGQNKCGNTVPHYESHLTALILPNTVTSIGRGALSECDVLDSIVIMAVNPPTLAENNVLGDLALSTKIYVPCQAVETYKTTTLWQDRASQIFGYGYVPFPTYIDTHFYTAIDCDCYSSFKDTNIAAITIANDGAMYLPDMLGETVVNESVENFNITIIKNMNKEAWNLIGSIGELQNITYSDFLGTFGGDFEFAGLPYYDNKWESDLKATHKQENYPNPEYARWCDPVIAKQSFLVWPYAYQLERDSVTGERLEATGTPQYGMKVSVASNQLQEFKPNNGQFTYDKTWSATATDLDENNNHRGYYFALYNPYVGLLNINNFVTANASQIQGGKVYLLNSAGDNFLAHDASNMNITDIAPARGFLVATTDAANKKISITMNNDMLVKTATKVNNSKAGRYDGKMTFTAEANNTVHAVVAHMDADADNGFDNQDAYIVISSGNDNYVEPYFVVDSRKIYENVFQTLPYEIPINFNARKQSDVYFYAKNIPDSIEVSIIDIANETETILENGEDFNFTAEVGTNANRYKMKFAKKNSASSIVSIAEVENIEVRFTQTANEINVFGDGLQSFEIINTLGQTVKKTNDSKVNISDLQSGAYVIKIKTTNGTAKDKFIK